MLELAVKGHAELVHHPTRGEVVDARERDHLPRSLRARQRERFAPDCGGDPAAPCVGEHRPGELELRAAIEQPQAKASTSDRMSALARDPRTEPVRQPMRGPSARSRGALSNGDGRLASGGRQPARHLGLAEHPHQHRSVVLVEGSQIQIWHRADIWCPE